MSGIDGALQDRGIQNVWLQTGGGEQLSGSLCLFSSLLREVYVHPTGEEVFLIPFGVAVTQEDEVVGHNPKV